MAALAVGEVDDERGDRAIVADQGHGDAGCLQGLGDEQEIGDAGLDRG